MGTETPERVFITVRDALGVECVQRGLLETESWSDDFAEEMRRHLVSAGAVFRDR